MATKGTFYICETCKQPILSATAGFVIRGNIMTADGNGGLIGNAFPENNPFGIEDVKEYAFCKQCFLEALMIKTEPTPRGLR